MSLSPGSGGIPSLPPIGPRVGPHGPTTAVSGDPGRSRYPITPERRAELVAAEVTLDGQRASITGTLLPFARVRSLEDPARSAEWAWETVDRIVGRGGAFRT